MCTTKSEEENKKLHGGALKRCNATNTKNNVTFERTRSDLLVKKNVVCAHVV